MSDLVTIARTAPSEELWRLRHGLCDEIERLKSDLFAANHERIELKGRLALADSLAMEARAERDTLRAALDQFKELGLSWQRTEISDATLGCRMLALISALNGDSSK